MALSPQSLEDAIRPQYLAEYDRQTRHGCHLLDVDTTTAWFPRTCCDAHKARDNRTPGLFKIEHNSDGMISLCSKSYVCKDKDGGVTFSAKGIMKRQMTNTFKFREVLTTGKTLGATNVGFQAHENTIFT